jgi:uncharacterized membrane protein YkvA (DUF1232 family)
MGRLRDWARTLKREILALWLASRDPRTPWPAKVLAVVVVGYALSPIDLIPDFIPVLGYLDDVILLPIGIWLVLRLVPPELMAELRVKAAEIADRPVNHAAALVIVAIWLLSAGLLGWALYAAFSRGTDAG